MMRDGRILWTRSEYLDKGADFGHTLWAIRPDGGHPELVFGNDMPYCYGHGREVPGSQELVCTLDLWLLGKPRGHGARWRDTKVAAGEASDPYLVTGYDEKDLELAHDAAVTLAITLEADVCGDGRWTAVQAFAVPPGEVCGPTTSR